MLKPPHPTVRVGDQLLMVRAGITPKPFIWRCVQCPYVATMKRPMQYAGEDHMRAVHCREDGE